MIWKPPKLMIVAAVTVVGYGVFFPIFLSAGEKEGAGGEKVKEVIPSSWLGLLFTEKTIAAAIPHAWAILKHELLDLAVPREDAIRIAKRYLTHPLPLIRYGASITLLTLGDRSGVQALIGLVKEARPIPVGDSSADRLWGSSGDLRIWAAMSLAEFREAQARDAVADLHFATHDLSVRSYAIDLGSERVIPDLLQGIEERVSPFQLVGAARLGAIAVKPIAAEKFSDPKTRPKVRIAAAEAMIYFGEKEPYFGFLRDLVSKYASDDSSKRDSDLQVMGRGAMNVIGLIRSDETKATLERALDSRNDDIAEIALIQLRVNYPESGKAQEKLIDGLSGKSRINTSTAFRLAAMSTDPKIRAIAAEANDMLWQAAALHERDWDRDAWLRSAGAKK